MAHEYDTATSRTLLFRVRDVHDHEAWDLFVQRYAPKIYHWCRQFHLQESDAADVTQDVLYKLVRAMQGFDYDPSKGSFRGWLKVVTGNATRNVIAGWKSHTRGGGGEKYTQWLATIDDPGALDALAAGIEAEAQQELLEAASYRVQLRVKPHTWKAYQGTAVERQSPAEVARALDMPVAEVYVAKSRVLKLLREEVDKLSGTET